MKTSAIVVLLCFLAACTVEETAEPVVDQVRPDIIATNAFYYYDDVESAWEFYRDTLGFETVIDYGFAKIVRLADTSYLTLVQASEGMHSADEPKTVTLSLVTDELSRWHEHLAAQNVTMLVDYVETDGNKPNSFVATDPGGYALKFVRFNPHPNHESFVAAFADNEPVLSSVANASGDLSIRASAHSVYFESLEGIPSFYEGLLGIEVAGQLEGLPAYQVAGSGFLVLVEGGDELHEPTVLNGVTLSFLSSDVDAWFERATSWPGFELRTPEILVEAEVVRVFVGYDPTGKFLEWDTFLNAPENAALLKYLP